jgi:hypothetical protein
MGKRFYVYAIYDPRDGVCRYIGKGSRARAFMHLGNTHNQKLAEMLKDCEAAGLFVEPKILETFATSKGATHRERELIRWHSPTLFNVSGLSSDSPHKTNRRFEQSPVFREQYEIRLKLWEQKQKAQYDRALRHWINLKP